MNIIPFEKSFASHEKSQYWIDKNGDIRPSNVALKSNKKYWFNCISCNHVFDIALNNISAGKWCPFCRSNKLCESETCNICFDKSFASHDKAQYWSSKNNKNPRLVTKKSDSEKFWFNCDKCVHDFDLTPGDISSGKWCPYCSIPTKRLCENNLCQMCFNKSFASNNKAKCWSNKNGNINPRNVCLGSNQKYWFDCDNCFHCFEITLTGINRGNWCSYCCNPPQKLCDNNCTHCFTNSFASHKKSQYWSSKNGDTKPRDVFKSTHKKYWFDCNICGHLFESILSDITKNGSWCGYCGNIKLCVLINHLLRTKNHNIGVVKMVIQPHAMSLNQLLKNIGLIVIYVVIYLLHLYHIFLVIVVLGVHIVVILLKKCVIMIAVIVLINRLRLTTNQYIGAMKMETQIHVKYLSLQEINIYLNAIIPIYLTYLYII